MDEERLNIAVRKFLKEVGVTSQREIERVVREGKVEGTELKLRMTLKAENAPLEHVVEGGACLMATPKTKLERQQPHEALAVRWTRRKPVGPGAGATQMAPLN